MKRNLFFSSATAAALTKPLELRLIAHKIARKKVKK